MTTTDDKVNYSNDDAYFSYSWLIKDIQHLYYNPKRFKGIFSDSFYSPILKNDNDINPGQLWRILFFPNHSDGVGDQFGIFLAPFQTEFELNNNINRRETTFRFEVLIMNDKYETISNFFTKISTINFKLEGKKNAETISVYCPIKSIISDNGGLKSKHMLIKFYFFSNKSIAQKNVNDWENFEEYFDDVNFSDLTFTFDCGSKLKVSKVILASRSSYFKTMFTGEWKESNERVSIEIKDSKYESFKSMIYFLYTGKLEDNLSFDILKDLYFEADMRDIEGLKNLMVNRLCNNIIDNWDEILMMGWKTNNDVLKKTVLTFVHDNWNELKYTEKFKKVLRCENEELVDEFITAKFF